MKNITIKLSLALTLILLNSCQSFINYKSDPQNKIVAKYNDNSITLKEAQMQINNISPSNNLKYQDLNFDQKNAVIKEVVIRKIANNQAKKQGLQKDKNHQAKIDFIKSEALKNAFYQKIIKANITPENLQKRYRQLSEELQGKNDINISYIALKSKKDAKSVHKILKKYPKSFAKQAKKKSIDVKTAENGGNLGFVFEDLLASDIVKQANNLKKNQISQPFSLNDKWLIVKLEDIRAAKVADFEDVKENIAKDIGKKTIEDFIAKSMKSADIEIVVN